MSPWIHFSVKQDVNARENVLEASLKHYGLEKKTEKTDHGTLLVYYDGTMHVDAENAVDVDIQTVKLGTAPAELFV